MVLQQGTPIQVWGWGDSGSEVTVEFAGQRVAGTVQDGLWRAELKPVKAGGPHLLIVSDAASRLSLTNVLVGEVWVCSGQSNMEWPLKQTDAPERAIASATNAQIRLFKVEHARSDLPATNVQAAWVVCSPDVVRDFSAVGYYFGRELNRVRGVPVGLIGTHWGGTPAEAWTPQATLEGNSRYREEILAGYQRSLESYRTALERYRREKEEAQAAGREFQKREPREPWKPSVLYNAMVAPLVPVTIKGAIWYQGESNADRAEQYRQLFPDMIRSWRQAWAQGDFPFLCVQLAPHKAIQAEPGDSAWAELREAQLHATQVLPKVGMAVITDLGDEKDIHPRKKEPVGFRLALAARAIAYGESILYSGPVYRSHEVQSNRVVLHFDHVGRGLEQRGDRLTGFAVCGEDRVWRWAEAEIQADNTVTVGSEHVSKPMAVRYGWADCPVVNLWNKDGLPASPFRTDDFPLITRPK